MKVDLKFVQSSETLIFRAMPSFVLKVMLSDQYHRLLCYTQITLKCKQSGWVGPQQMADGHQMESQGFVHTKIVHIIFFLFKWKVPLETPRSLCQIERDKTSSKRISNFCKGYYEQWEFFKLFLKYCWHCPPS